MRKILLLLTLLIVILVPINVRAQDLTILSLLKVDIFPEYDQPGVLFIYHISLPQGTNLPASLTIRIPSDAQINAVAFVDPSNLQLFDTTYDKNVQGNWSVIKLTTPTLQVQIEYYSPLVKNGTVRHVSFEWLGDYDVESLDANFHKPSGAENLVTSLVPTDTSVGQDGLTIYQMKKAGLPAGEVFSLKIDYNRQTDDLNISSKPPQAVTTPGPATPGRVSMHDILPWILAGIGVVLLVGCVIGFFVWQRAGQASGKGKKHTARRITRDEVATYCPQCGKRAQPGDAFCRTCGTRLKKGMTK